jgi:histidinol-phosphatase (PHP family)
MHEYVESAIQRGLTEIGFADHLPLVAQWDPQLTMAEKDLPEYVESVLKLRERYPQIAIRLGIEADYLEGREDDTRALLDRYEWDYVLGSVHMINQWEFDDSRTVELWETQNIDAVYRNYYRLLRRSAESGLFDIIAHCDLVKKFGHRPQANMREEIEQTAQVFQACGVAIEINTSGQYKPAREMYPSPWIQEIFARREIPLVISSDAHAPEEVGRDFDLAIESARAAGFKETVLFRQRQIVERRPFPKPGSRKHLKD